MQTDIVVMPVANRPEMLALSLERLSLAQGTPEVRIFVDCVGQTRLDEFEHVRDTYYPLADLYYAQEHTPCVSGTWNILQALKAGYDSGAGLVFLIEEDIMVRPDYFDWHRQEMATGQYLATCGRKDPRFYPLHPDLYTNPGSCLRRDLLERLCCHINDDYFVRLRAYLDEKFPVWDETSCLDDGLIRRVIREMGGRVAYPEVAKCAHQGWKFYNRLDIYENKGTIEERIVGLRKMIASVKPADRYAGDFES